MLMATNSPGILIVDDNEDNRYTLQLMLETDGHERIASASAHGSPGWEEAGLGLPRRSFTVAADAIRRQARGDVDGVAPDVEDEFARADNSCHHRAGVQADPDRKRGRQGAAIRSRMGFHIC